MAGIYLSYPFCSQKCTYCNFSSGVLPRDLEPRYIRALQKEIAEAEFDWQPETIYLGGGTPSNMDLDSLASIVAQRDWIEATIEAAPGNIDAVKARAWRKAGINRVSLGVQSFITEELRRTGRKHDFDVVRGEVRDLRAAGVGNFNIDLIAGLPGQTRESWNTSLERLLLLDPPHVSVYMLEIDEDSRLGAEVIAFGQRYGAPDVPGDELIVELYETAVDRLAAAGIARYEISNFALPGFESCHNLKYWLREPYLGFGADAHSFDVGQRWENVASAAEYVERLEQGRTPVAARSEADPVAESFFLGLRLARGIDAGEARKRGFIAEIQELMQDGLLEESDGRLRLTRRGILVSNEVFQKFLPDQTVGTSES